MWHQLIKNPDIYRTYRDFLFGIKDMRMKTIENK